MCPELSLVYHGLQYRVQLTNENSDFSSYLAPKQSKSMTIRVSCDINKRLI